MYYVRTYVCTQYVYTHAAYVRVYVRMCYVCMFTQNSAKAFKHDFPPLFTGYYNKKAWILKCVVMCEVV